MLFSYSTFFKNMAVLGLGIAFSMSSIMRKNPDADQAAKKFFMHTTGVFMGIRVNWHEQDIFSATLGYLAGWKLSEFVADILTNKNIDPDMSLIISSAIVGVIATGLMVYNKPNPQQNHQQRL